MGRTVATSRSKKAAPPNHPKYEDMIRDAIIALKERKGSSRQAIKKHILTTFKLPDNTVTSNRLKLAINKGVEKGLFSFVNGPSGTIKLVKKEPVKKEKKEVEKKETKPKKAEKKEKPKAEKKPVKKTAAKKTATKKPAAKSKKSTAAKKTKKVVKKAADKKTTRKKSSN